MTKELELEVFGMRGETFAADVEEVEYWDVVLSEVDWETYAKDPIEEHENLTLDEASKIAIRLEREHNLTAEWWPE